MGLRDDTKALLDWLTEQSDVSSVDIDYEFETTVTATVEPSTGGTFEPGEKEQLEEHFSSFSDGSWSFVEFQFDGNQNEHIAVFER